MYDQKDSFGINSYKPEQSINGYGIAGIFLISVFIVGMLYKYLTI